MVLSEIGSGIVFFCRCFVIGVIGLIVGGIIGGIILGLIFPTDSESGGTGWGIGSPIGAIFLLGFYLYRKFGYEKLNISKQRKHEKYEKDYLKRLEQQKTPQQKKFEKKVNYGAITPIIAPVITNKN